MIPHNQVVLLVASWQQTKVTYSVLASYADWNWLKSVCVGGDWVGGWVVGGCVHQF
jgi:hypothetical protein